MKNIDRRNTLLVIANQNGDAAAYIGVISYGADIGIKVEKIAGTAEPTISNSGDIITIKNTNRNFFLVTIISTNKLIAISI